MIPIVITNQDLAQKLIEAINHVEYIAFDTEFFRRDTYYAKLALLQLAIETEIYIVDATIVDVKPIWHSVATSKAIKIIHSGRQDLEIMYNLFGILPNNLFDTQIAAKFCSFRADSSYAELCKIICNIEDLDKNLQNSNWLKRPLTEQMINYAALDVKYLYQIYRDLWRIIKEQNLEEKLQEVIYDSLIAPEIYTKTVENAWKKIKYYKNNERFIRRLKVICAFREHAAQNFDIPRRFFLTDEQVIFICNTLPHDETKLNQIQNLSSYAIQDKYKSKLLELCNIISQKEAD